MQKTLKCVLVSLSIILVLVLITVNLVIFCPPGILLDIDPKSKDYEWPSSFSGPLKQNSILSKAEKLFENQIEGPESIAIWKESVFTSSRNGYIYQVDIQSQRLTPLIKIINSSCDVWNQTLCSRPLAMKFDSKGTLYVVEPFFGIYRINDILTTKPRVESVLSYSRIETLTKSSKFLDDFAIEEKGGVEGGPVLYITDLSTDFDLSQIILAISGRKSGRILRYDINADKLEVVLDNLECPNGIEMSQDQHSLIFAETCSRRILKHHIKGPKQGQTITLIDKLPGEPDNIRKTQNQTYWVAIAAARCQQNLHFFDHFDNKPLLRKLFFRSLHLTGSVVKYFGHLFDWTFMKNLGFELQTGLHHFLVLNFMGHSHGLALEFNELGTIVRSIHSPEGKISLLSEANQLEVNKTNVLYLGSVYNNYLGVLRL